MGCRHSAPIANAPEKRILRPNQILVRATSRTIRDSASSVEQLGQLSSRTCFEAEDENASLLEDSFRSEKKCDSASESSRLNDFSLLSRQKKREQAPPTIDTTSGMSSDVRTGIYAGENTIASNSFVAKSVAKNENVKKSNVMQDVSSSSSDDECTLVRAFVVTPDALTNNMTHSGRVNTFADSFKIPDTFGESSDDDKSLDALLMKTRRLLNRTAPVTRSVSMNPVSEPVLEAYVGSFRRSGNALLGHAHTFSGGRLDVLHGNISRSETRDAAARKRTTQVSRHISDVGQHVDDVSVAVDAARARIAHAKEMVDGRSRGTIVYDTRGREIRGSTQRNRVPITVATNYADAYSNANVRSVTQTNAGGQVPFERTRRRSIERTAGRSAARGSDTSTASSQSCYSNSKKSSREKDECADLRLAIASASLARVEAARHEVGNEPANARANRPAPSLDHSKRIQHILDRYKSRYADGVGIGTGVGDINSRGTPDFSLHRAISHNPNATFGLSTSISRSSPTVRRTYLTAKAPVFRVAPMSDKMLRARAALRVLQIPGVTDVTPRRARVSDTSANMCVKTVQAIKSPINNSQKVSAAQKACAPGRPASHLVRGHY